MKLGFLGNLNNFNFSIVRYLRDKGYDAELLLLNEPKHFKPNSDSYDENYKDYTIQLDWNWRDLSIFFRKKHMLKEVEKYDKLLGINFAPAYCELIGRKLDVFIPAGSDIYRCPFKFFLQKYSIKTPRDYYYDVWANLQRRGIEKSGAVFYDKTNEELEAKILPLNIEDKRICENPPFLYYPQYSNILSNDKVVKSEYNEKFKMLREKHDLIVFQHCRQDWVDSKMIFYNKGNNKLIEAFGRLVKEGICQSPLLVLFEYGKDVDKSKELVSALDIGNNVIWMPISMRKDIMIAIQYADIGVGELGEVSWLSYATVYEFICMKKPFIGYRDDSLYENYPELYPMFSANTVEGVYSHLLGYVKNKEYYSKEGILAFEWFRKYAVNKPLETLEALLVE